MHTFHQEAQALGQDGKKSVPRRTQPASTGATKDQAETATRYQRHTETASHVGYHVADAQTPTIDDQQRPMPGGSAALDES